MPIDLFINEPDIYAAIDFSLYAEFQNVYRPGDAFDPSTVGAICISLKDVVDDEFLKPYANVRTIVSNTTAVDHIKTTRDAEIIHLDPAEIQNITATAEFTLTLMLSLVRKVPFLDPAKPDDRIGYRGMQLNGKQIGIFGFGRLGKWMSRYCEALGMIWKAFDKGDSTGRQTELLETSDIISIHLPLRDETIGFFSFDEFAQMKKKPYLINTSRPQIVHKPALIQALETGQIAGAAMDFINYDASFRWDPEMQPFTKKNLLLTPHIAGNTHDSVAFTAKIVVDKLAKRVAG